ncbi:MAG: hypothetical protein NTX04_07330 [Verrucomicrobia bacterium]|nr:hypothetical protein [Verrucomicrobiota bacterium]
MSSHLDPLILKKLQTFARRRRFLIISRGVLAATAMLVASMLVVAFLDYSLFLSDSVRWALSGSAYIAVIGVVW